MAEEEPCLGQAGGGLARGEYAAEIQDGARDGCLTPALGGGLAGLAFFGSAHQREGVLGVEFAEARQQRPPVLPAPVLGLHLGADADGEDRLGVRGLKDLVRPGSLGRGEPQVPGLGRVYVGVAELGQVARQAFRLGLERSIMKDAMRLHGLGQGNADLTLDAAEPEEPGIAPGCFDAAYRTEIDEPLWPPAPETPPQAEEKKRTARRDGVTEVTVNQTVVRKNCRSGRSLHADREVGEHSALGVGEGALH